MQHLGGPPHVIVGGGPAAASAASVLVQSDPGAQVVVLSAERIGPYDRTTLSKQVLGQEGVQPPALWQEDEPGIERVDLRTGQRVTSLDPEAHTVCIDSGETIPFGTLLLATGAEPRRLAIPGVDGAGVHYLRDADDARALQSALRGADRVVLIGGGVVGLEVAASVRSLGPAVHVVEAAPRVLGRGVPEQVAAWLVDLHRAHGVLITAGCAPTEVLRVQGRVTGVRRPGATDLGADIVVVGVGVVARDRLARDAGLAVDDGILVDRGCRTSHPDVFAAGDCARMRSAPGDRGIRLESYQPAGRQGEVAARAMLGGDEEYDDVPWSWSDQFDATMHSAGLAPGGADTVRCGDTEGVLVLSFQSHRLVAACGAAHGSAMARSVRAAARLIAAGAPVDRAALFKVSNDLAAVDLLLRSAAQNASRVG